MIGSKKIGVSTYPGRVKLTKANGSSEYVTMERPCPHPRRHTDQSLFDSIKDDIDGKFSKLGGNINGNMTIQKHCSPASCSIRKPTRSRLLQRRKRQQRITALVFADINKNGGTDMPNVRSSANHWTSCRFMWVTPDMQSMALTQSRGVATLETALPPSVKSALLATATLCIVHSANGTSIVMARGAIRVGGGVFSWPPPLVRLISRTVFSTLLPPIPR